MKHTKSWFPAVTVNMVNVMLAFSFPVMMVRAEGISKPAASTVMLEKTSSLYDEIDFSNGRKLSREVFEKAYIGYLNLKETGVAKGRDIISVCDFSLSSNVPRLWVIDIKKKKVLFNTLVAHGRGSGEEYATSFSNIQDSHQSSMGFFVTEDTYYGDKGYSLKIHGKDNGYNDKAYDRAIVIHGADYVSNNFIQGNQRLGRSWGCPALPQGLNRPIIDAIKGGTTFFIYAPNKRYLASSKWLNRTPKTLNNLLMPTQDDKKTMLADNLAGENASKSSEMDNANNPQVKKVVERKPIPAEAYFQ